MISLNEIPSSALKEIIALVEKREKLEEQLRVLLKEAEANIPAPSKTKRRLGIVQPRLTDLITEILTEAKRPMTVQEIYEASLDKGYTWRSGNPINALNVKMYTDKAFRKSSPGYFEVRGK
jgi:hypothetical protein